MRVRTKLALAFIVLIVLGIMTIASYTIFVVRGYMEENGRRQLQHDAERLGLAFRNLGPHANAEGFVRDIHATTGYAVVVFDSAGNLLFGLPQWQEAFFPAAMLATLEPAGAQVSAPENSEYLYAFVHVQSPWHRVAYVRLGQAAEATSGVVKQIRWIVYTGMFLSIALVVVASTIIARWISGPVFKLRNQARRVAAGHLDTPLALEHRRDEFGELAKSLNQMADSFRARNAELQRLYEQQRQFFADIAHEVRNPLHAMMASLELLRLPGIPPEKHSQHLQVAQRQAERLRNLFEDLMTLEKSDRDPNFIKPTLTNLGDITQALLSTFEGYASEKGLGLSIETRPQPVWADARRLEQVLVNLLSNALKFTQQGGVALSYAQTGSRVEIAVTDTGPGIAPEHVPHLFQRFYRTDAARSRDAGGTGLGLAVAQRLVQAHGHSLRVESALGAGTRFWFTLEAAPPSL